MAPINGRTWLSLNPTLGSELSQFVRFCSRLEQGVSNDQGLISSNTLKIFRKELALGTNRPHPVEEIKLRVVQNVILDLVAQNWQLKVDNGVVRIHSPLQQSGSPNDEKERIRRGHLLERDSQLSKKAVVAFVKSMERKRLTKKGWHSIFSVMRDGIDLSEKLRRAALINSDQEKALELAETISPYIQFIEGDEICDKTGLRLRDIWRYFRLTWVNSYKSVPGRSIMILIRDAASPNHPIIGIAALGSSVVQQKVRDKHIGWDADSFTEKLIQHPSSKWAEQLHASLSKLIGDIYLDDLLADPTLEFERKHLRKPTHSIIERLRKEAKSARHLHHLNPHLLLHKAQAKEPNDRKYWEQKARTMLFRSKRCAHLANLLSIKMKFREHRFVSGSGKQLREAIRSTHVRSAIGQLVRLIKAEHVGIDMMDITVCGAVAPYNSILGGKLVCMLLGSPEVVKFYATKYDKQPSIIASSMKGKPVRRPHNLALLCTTSLYGVGSSQYNRVKVPTEVVGGQRGGTFRYEHLGYSVGFGSFHFSQETLGWIKFLLGRQGNRRVNSIFGEGVNPLMRKIREALDSVGLAGDEILWHGNKRVIYGVPLASNYREILLGFHKRPRYLVPQQDASQRTVMLAEYWRERWLSSRINNPEILEKVAEHALTHPIRHGARVPSSNDIAETSYLWDVR